MKTIHRILVIWLSLFCLAGCGSDRLSKKEEIVIQVNNCSVSLGEFNDLFKFEAYADPELELTNDSRERFIDYLVSKELMIEEATRLKLDQEPEFARAIEKHWESTLICNLLCLKSDELKKKILITEEQLERYYAQNKDAFDGPLAEAKTSIRDILERKALEEHLKQWTEDLKKDAYIKINTQLMTRKHHKAEKK